VSEILEAVLRRDRWIAGGGIALLVLMAWAWLLAGAGMGMSAVDMTRMVYGDHSVMKTGAMADPSWDLAYWILMFSMWWVMMAAMMLPSAAPTILLAAAVNRKAEPGASPFGNTNRFTLGYLLAWGGFSLLATATQWALEHAGVLSSMTLDATNRWLGGSLLLAAAVWQFTPLKQVCLRHCRSPIEFLVTRRSNGPLLMGIEHGAWCLGCCWFLMGLLFVGGVMNLFWIAGLSVFVLLEKLLPHGRGMGYLLGAVMAAGGVLLWAGLV
jgi:predicted metal-binding membrane protein